MKNRYFTFLALSFLVHLALAQSSSSIKGIQNFEKYTLNNGLTVYLIENKDAPNIYGSVVCKVGKKNDPSDIPAMAHCLEHMLFKGTEEMGTTDWNAEKPHYEKIVSLYRLLDNEKESAKIAELKSQIKEASIAADKYNIKGEMFGYIKRISGNFNGLTANDYTTYYNIFSPEMLEKWLHLYSHRFANPVFRGFLNELDVLSQEYYLRTSINTNLYDHIQRKLFHQIPVKEIQGTIKEMSLSKVIDYYNKYYVANNMCVIVAGNFKSEEIKPLIAKYFAALKVGEIPVQTNTPLPDFSDKRIRNAYIDLPYSKLFCYNTIPINHEDFTKFQLGLSILADAKFGLLEKQRNQKKISSAYPINLNSNDFGFTGFKIQNGNLLRLPSITKTLTNEIKNITISQYSDSLLEIAKRENIQKYHIHNESTEWIGQFITQLFVYNLNDSFYTNYPAIINAIEKNEIARVFSDNFDQKPVILSSKPWFSLGKAKYSKSIKTDDKLQSEGISKYGTIFDSIPLFRTPIQFVDFKSVSDSLLCKGVKLSCSPNPSNNVFTLTFRYAPSQKVWMRQQKFRSIEPLISDMNNTRYDFGLKTAHLGASHSFSRPYKLNLEVTGEDENFGKTLNAYSGLIKNPTYHPYDRKIAKNKAPWFVRCLVKRHAADTVTHTIRMAMRTLTNVEYCGTLPIDTVYEQLQKHFNFSELSLDRYKYPNELFFNRSPKTYVRFEMIGEKCGPADRLNLLLYNQYLKLKFNYEIIEKRNLGYDVLDNLTYPQKDSIVPNLTPIINSTPSSVLELIAQTTKEIKKPLDSLLFVRAKMSLKNQLMEDIPINRAKIDRVLKWKQNGIIEDPTNSDLDTLDGMYFAEFEKFCNKVFAKKELTIRVNSKKAKIGRKEYKDFLKKFEYGDL